MGDTRFYISNSYVCPRCGMVLLWERRLNSKDSMMLTHGRYHVDGVDDCPNNGKSFYAPVANLTEIPPDMMEI